MSALSLAVIGKDREPLYMREFKDSASFSSDEELFGLPTLGSESNAKVGGFECSIRHQFILHAALDRYEQLAGPPPGLGFRFGLLTPVEEMRVYGTFEPHTLLKPLLCLPTRRTNVRYCLCYTPYLILLFYTSGQGT